MFQPTRLRLLPTTAHRARTAKRHRWNAKCFYPLQIQGIERLKERGLQFILHIAPPLGEGDLPPFLVVDAADLDALPPHTRPPQRMHHHRRRPRNTNLREAAAMAAASCSFLARAASPMEYIYILRI